MNKQGQVNLNLGLLISVAVAVIVGAVLMVGVASYVGQTSATYVHNDSLTGASTGTAGVPLDLVGQDLLSTPIVRNNTGDVPVSDANYTISEVVSTSTGVKTISLLIAAGSEYDGQPINISYEYGAEGYIDSGGGRAVASLILLFMALLIGTVALAPVLRNKVLDLAGI